MAVRFDKTIQSFRVHESEEHFFKGTEYLQRVFKKDEGGHYV